MRLTRLNSHGIAETTDTGTEHVRTYKRRSLPIAVFSTAFFLISIALCAAVSPHFAFIIGSVLVLFVYAPLALDFRRTIKLSEKGFEYKWRSGRVTDINVADVEKIDGVTMPYMMFPGKVTFVTGLRVSLRTGEVRVFPLDFPDREEILGSLGAMVLRASASREPEQIGS
jgi:hypothetical protein